MANPTPYRALPAERRHRLLKHAIASSREVRALYVQRLAALPGGFRAVTLQSWPADKLAQEVVRRRAEKPEDEADLLLLLYVEIHPEIQAAFLDAAGVKHEGGRIDDELEAPYADEAGVRRGVEAVRERFGSDGAHYLWTILRYNRAGWPGIETLVEDAPPV